MEDVIPTHVQVACPISAEDIGFPGIQIEVVVFTTTVPNGEGDMVKSVSGIKLLRGYGEIPHSGDPVASLMFNPDRLTGKSDMLQLAHRCDESNLFYQFLSHRQTQLMNQRINSEIIDSFRPRKLIKRSLAGLAGLGDAIDCPASMKPVFAHWITRLDRRPAGTLDLSM